MGDSKERLRMTDNAGIIYREGRLLKLERYRGLTAIYVEVDVAEYDRRIIALAERIAQSPSVNLLDVLKDALYDLHLDRLEKIEKMLNDETVVAQAEQREPKVATTTRERGTCVNLAIGGKYALNLRE